MSQDTINKDKWQLTSKTKIFTTYIKGEIMSYICHMYVHISYISVNKMANQQYKSKLNEQIIQRRGNTEGL